MRFTNWILGWLPRTRIDMPFPPFQMRLESLSRGKTNGEQTLTSAGKTSRPAGSFVPMVLDDAKRLR